MHCMIKNLLTSIPFKGRISGSLSLDRNPALITKIMAGSKEIIVKNGLKKGDKWLLIALF
ncbi:hypothetical protein Mh1961_07090 [Mannheimia haemolytica]